MDAFPKVAEEFPERFYNTGVSNAQDGSSAHALEDLAIFRAFPSMAVVACGPHVGFALETAEELAKEEGLNIEIIDNHSLSPIDKQTIIASAKKTGAVVTVEDHNINGGLGSAVAEVLGENLPTLMVRVGLRDFATTGDYQSVIEYSGIGEKDIKRAIVNVRRLQVFKLNMKKGDIKTKIFLDGGDPTETRRAKKMLGWLDGQTTNPTLIARNLRSNHKRSNLLYSKRLDLEEALKEYRRIVEEMAEIIPDGSISIQVFANKDTAAQEMLSQARERNKWIQNASIKFPCTTEGLQAAEEACQEMNVNITLVFSQAQAAAVYEATKKTKHSVYLSPFVGRLDDRGENGMDIIRNILQMFGSSKFKVQSSNLARIDEKPSFEYPKSSALKSHVEVLTASVRNLDHLLYAIHLGSDIATVPFKVFEEWSETDFTLPREDYMYGVRGLKPIPYDDSIELGRPWQEYDLSHPLTDKGLAAFWEDWNSLFE